MMTDMKMLASKARDLASQTGGITEDVFPEYIQYAMELIEILQERVPTLLQKEKFFKRVFKI